MKVFDTSLPEVPVKRKDLPAWGEAVRSTIEKNWSGEPQSWDLAVLQLRGPSKRHPLDDLFAEVIDAAEGLVLSRSYHLKTVAIRMAPDVVRSQLKLLQQS